MAPSTAINTLTLAVITITVKLVTTTQQRELQVQIAKLAVRGSTARPLEPQARLRVKTAARGSSAPQLGSLRVKTAARGSTARPLEPQATLHV